MQSKSKAAARAPERFYLDDPFLMAHLREQPSTDGNLFDFVLFQTAVNGKPGMKVAGAGVIRAELVLPSGEAADPATVPCQYGQFCFRGTCRFAHASWWNPVRPCMDGPGCAKDRCPFDHRPGLHQPKVPVARLVKKKKIRQARRQARAKHAAEDREKSRVVC